MLICDGVSAEACSAVNAAMADAGNSLNTCAVMREICAGVMAANSSEVTAAGLGIFTGTTSTGVVGSDPSIGAGAGVVIVDAGSSTGVDTGPDADPPPEVPPPTGAGATMENDTCADPDA